MAMIRGLEKNQDKLTDGIQYLAIYGQGGFGYETCWMMSSRERQQLVKKLKEYYKEGS